MLLPTQVQFNWPRGFSGEDFFQKSTNQKQELPVVAMLVNGSELNEQSLLSNFHICFLLSLGSFGLAVSEKIVFQKSTNHKQELPVVAMLVNGSELNKQSLLSNFHICFLLSLSSFGQAVSEKICFRNQPMRNKNYLWWPNLLTSQH